jgi:hypothetical protein
MADPTDAGRILDTVSIAESSKGDTQARPYGNGAAADVILDNLVLGLKS